LTNYSKLNPVLFPFLFPVFSADQMTQTSPKQNYGKSHKAASAAAAKKKKKTNNNNNKNHCCFDPSTATASESAVT